MHSLNDSFLIDGTVLSQLQLNDAAVFAHLAHLRSVACEMIQF